MQIVKQLLGSLGSVLLDLGFVGFQAAVPASPAKAPAVKPAMTLHYVYNCTDPTVEVDISGLSGPKDVYAHVDSSYTLIAQNYNFDATKTYDGYWSMNGVYQVDLFVTAVGAGPYANHLVGKSTAATSQCPTYYPVYDAHYVNPTPPAGSTPIDLNYIADYPNK